MENGWWCRGKVCLAQCWQSRCFLCCLVPTCISFCHTLGYQNKGKAYPNLRKSLGYAQISLLLPLPIQIILNNISCVSPLSVYADFFCSPLYWDFPPTSILLIPLLALFFFFLFFYIETHPVENLQSLLSWDSAFCTLLTLHWGEASTWCYYLEEPICQNVLAVWCPWSWTFLWLTIKQTTLLPPKIL